MLGVVFAAGLGTRLRPLTEALPKPAVPLLNRPLAGYSLERLVGLGIRRVALNTHHLGEAVAREVGGDVPAGVEARFVHEERLLGTGGGLRHAVEALGHARDEEETLVMNGDILFWPDLEGALALHRRLGAVATVVLRPDPRARQLGALEIDEEGRVRRMLGRPERVEGPLRELMFTGVHVLSARALRDLPGEGCIIRTSYRRWIDEGEVVAGFVDESAWRDLGTPGEYLRASVELLRGELGWPSFAPGDGALVGEGAELGAGVTLVDAVVGPGARVEAGVRLERAIVWAGAHVRADAVDAIVAPHAVVRVGDAA